MRAHCNVLSSTPFPYPLNPLFFDLSYHFPKRFLNKTIDETEFQNRQQKLYLNTRTEPSFYDKQISNEGVSIDFIDIGCGYGGLLFALSPHFPNKNIMGFEIRDTIVEYVGKKIRSQRLTTEGFNNISILRTNTQRHLTNYIPESSLEKIFICFPDPNFKKGKHNRRIVN